MKPLVDHALSPWYPSPCSQLTLRPLLTSSRHTATTLVACLSRPFACLSPNKSLPCLIIFHFEPEGAPSRSNSSFQGFFNRLIHLYRSNSFFLVYSLFYFLLFLLVFPSRAILCAFKLMFSLISSARSFST